MTLQELNDTVQYLLIGFGMFVIATYLVFVMFGAFNFCNLHIDLWNYCANNCEHHHAKLLQ